MNRFLVAAIKSPARGRRVIVVYLNCVQAAAPDWPLVMIWPLVKLSLASSIVHLSGSKHRRIGLRAHAASARILRIPEFGKLKV